MIITNAQYIRDPLYDRINAIKANINGQVMFVPLDPANTTYAEMMQQVDAGKLTIQEAVSE